MGGEQDMRKMGGLRKKIPVTYWTMLIATLAIAGIPGFAGFFSKDEILEAASSGPHANISLWLMGLVAAGLTSFYMFRLVFLTFFGKPRYDEHKVHVHESPKSMTVPLIIAGVPVNLRRLVCRAPPDRRQSITSKNSCTRFFRPTRHPMRAYADLQTKLATDGVSPHGQLRLVQANGEFSDNSSAAMKLVRALLGWPVIVAILGLARGLVVLHPQAGIAQEAGPERPAACTRSC
jgi:NADH:ubiquinone oxidoreductase subunit 5 (subunit L)/multisubunit Na+/H+ antiporter MnhA subunit